jgi:UDP-N-acetylmuramoyl-tripeptide--D-alanyl-D-alanine ligase
MSAFTWTDAAVRDALGLRVDRALPDAGYTGVSTDSRTAHEGDLYVALVGERFDGHDFVADALARGARGAVVSRPVEGQGSAALYPVADTLDALGALAAHRRRALAAPVVGITGSAGKTTTKDLTRAALAGSLRVHATSGNLNNRIGMPLTLLRVPTDAQVVVLEMGTNEPGEIAALAAVARPDIGVIVTVGEAHLEKLGSMEGVLHEKLDLLRGLADGGRCVVGDEPATLARAARGICPTVRVAGWSDGADQDLRPVGVEVDAWGAHRFLWRGRSVRLNIAGRHAVLNALLALAVADLLGVPGEDAVAGLAGVGAGSMRGEVRRIGDLIVVVDCYNANPPSVKAALDLLDARAARRKVVVLGTMLELGDASARLHREVLADALSRDLDLVVATGAFEEAAGAVAGTRGGAAPEVVAAPDWRSAYPALKARLAGDEVVLLKASRGVAMEGILALLDADFGSGDEEARG